MIRRSPPKYINKHSIQTLQQGLKEYYKINSSITDPRELPPEFGQILIAHDITHVVTTNFNDVITVNQIIIS
jgi:regulator of RNase E activity RraB